MSCASISYPHHHHHHLRPPVGVVGAVATTSAVHPERTPASSSAAAQLRPHPRSASIAMATCYAPFEPARPAKDFLVTPKDFLPAPKDYLPTPKDFLTATPKDFMTAATPKPYMSSAVAPKDFMSSPVAPKNFISSAVAPKDFMSPPAAAPAKDYSRPLHVDCSVEYELPNAAKPPPGGRSEPLLMIHPCYFRKIESQRRSPFVNNLPPPAAAAPRRRTAPRPQNVVPQPQPPPVAAAAAYPVAACQLWEPPAAAAQTYCKLAAAAAVAYDPTRCWGGAEAERSPDRPEDRHILSGKYRQYLRAHRLHPYVSSAIPIASTFPQVQQVCYNV